MDIKVSLSNSQNSKKKSKKSPSSGKKGKISKKSSGDASKSRKKSRAKSIAKKSQSSLLDGVKIAEEEESSSSSEGEDDEEDLSQIQEHTDFNNLPSEYWQIQKLVKYLKVGNPTATVLALCALQDCNLKERICQLAVRDTGGLEVLLNLLETGVLRCQLGALKILREISLNIVIRHSIVDLGGLESIVDILNEPSLELRCFLAETIANVARFRKAQRIVRKQGGIPHLVELLDVPESILHKPHSKLTHAEQQELYGAQCGALALWSLSYSARNKKAIWEAGAMSLLGRLLKSQHEDMLVPVVGTIQECAAEEKYRLAIREEKMLDDIQRHLSSENIELQKHCASTIFKCAEDAESRNHVGKHGGLAYLVNILNIVDLHGMKELMTAVTGAIWKCALSAENVDRLQDLGVVNILVHLLQTQPEEVLVNVVGAIGQCARLPANSVAIRKAGGIEPLVQLLARTNHALLVNVTEAVGACAIDPENMIIIENMDGVRLVWSHLKSKSPAVRSSAAWALCPCIQNAKNSAELVRSFVGGLELIVNLLQSEHVDVLVAVCAAISCIAQDEENLAVLTDYGIVNLLSQLASIDDHKLQHRLAEAIASCCPWKTNRIAFGTTGVVVPLVGYLKSNDTNVRQATVHALYQLSLEPTNCVTMHSHGAVKLLLKMVESSDEKVQEAAAGCLQNIRRLAMTREKAYY